MDFNFTKKDLRNFVILFIAAMVLIPLGEYIYSLCAGTVFAYDFRQSLGLAFAIAALMTLIVSSNPRRQKEEDLFEGIHLKDK